jgi:hypothetical protein
MYVLIAYNDFGPYEGLGNPVVIAYDKDKEKLYAFLKENKDNIVKYNESLYENYVEFEVREAKTIFQSLKNIKKAGIP